jgi:hypothetical protein
MGEGKAKVDYVEMNVVQIDHSASSAFQAKRESAKRNRYDWASVMCMSADNDFLARVFAEEKNHQADIHVLPYRPFSKESAANPAWYVCVVNNQVTLFLITTEPHRHMFLGEDVKMAVRKVFEIMGDRTGASWNPVPLSGAPE